MKIKFLLMAFLLTAFSGCGDAAWAAVPDDKAVLAIVGEGEAEPFEGKIALAKTIIKRNSLKGVYGLNAPRVKKRLYSTRTYLEAKKAWEIAKRTDLSDWDYIGWGNASDLVIFKRQAWFKKCIADKKIGNHHFYRLKG